LRGCGECGSGEQAELLRNTMVEKVAVENAMVEEAAVKNAMAD